MCHSIYDEKLNLLTWVITLIFSDRVWLPDQPEIGLLPSFKPSLKQCNFTENLVIYCLATLLICKLTVHPVSQNPHKASCSFPSL